MRTIPVYTTEGIKEEIVYELSDFPYEEVNNIPIVSRNTTDYLNVAASFDIETTNDPDTETAWMYQWQFCIDTFVIFGRTWDELLLFFKRLQEFCQISDRHRLVIYVHNLSFEWDFMRKFLEWKDVKLLSKRKLLCCTTTDGFTFRCSYKLSNMSLDKFCENTPGCIYRKLSEEQSTKYGLEPYDYSKIRNPLTNFTPAEESYHYNDVRGLCECITHLLKEDNIVSIPLTSTGYVRRDMRRHLYIDKPKARRYRELFKLTKLDEDMYTRCKRTFRGGDTHANYLWANQLLEDVESMDMTSAYPFVMMSELYPASKWYPTNMERIQKIDHEKTPCVWMALLKLEGNVHVKYGENPYISYSKCVGHQNVILDNGRVHAADMIAIWITNIDWEIIQWCYEYDRAYMAEMVLSRAKPLPEFIKEGVMDYYKPKTLLKGVENYEYEYMKSKNKLNACYGMAVTDIAKNDILYDEIEGYTIDASTSTQDKLDKYYNSRNSFLQYQQGIFVPAYCRYNLNVMLHRIGNNKVYWDTDSNKFIDPDGSIKQMYTEENERILKKAKECGAYAPDKDGNIVYMGIWDYEGKYLQFKTLGAKKYIYKKIKKGAEVIESTIAGVSKSIGQKFFTENGIEKFKIGVTIPKSGNLNAVYNDDPIREITRTDYQGNICTFLSASNVAMFETEYTIGITKDYSYLLEI